MSETELRKLDQRIHREVMGRSCRFIEDIGHIGEHSRRRQFVNYDWWDDEDRDAIPRYSTDIAAAWTVVEKMKQRVHMEVLFELFANEDGTWDAVFGATEHSSADSAPLAICRAALAAIGAAS